MRKEAYDSYEEQEEQYFIWNRRFIVGSGYWILYNGNRDESE